MLVLGQSKCLNLGSSSYTMLCPHRNLSLRQRIHIFHTETRKDGSKLAAPVILGLRNPCRDFVSGNNFRLSSPKGGEDSIRNLSSFGVLLTLPTRSPIIFHPGLASLLLDLPMFSIKCVRSVERQSKTTLIEPYTMTEQHISRKKEKASTTHSSASTWRERDLITFSRSATWNLGNPISSIADRNLWTFSTRDCDEGRETPL